MDRLTKFILAFALVFLLVIIVLGIVNRSVEQKGLQPKISSVPPATTPALTTERTQEKVDQNLEKLKQIKPEELTEAEFNAIVEELRKQEEQRLQALYGDQPRPKPVVIPAEEDSASPDYPMPMEYDQEFLPPVELPQEPDQH